MQFYCVGVLCRYMYVCSRVGVCGSKADPYGVTHSVPYMRVVVRCGLWGNLPLTVFTWNTTHRAHTVLVPTVCRNIFDNKVHDMS